MSERTSIRVATLNLLNDVATLPERFEQLRGDLSRLGADVVCVQEVVASQRERVDALFSEVGLVHRFHGRSVANTHGDSDGVAVYSRLPLVESGHIPFLDVADRPGVVPAVFAHVRSGGGDVYIASVHAVWGADQELTRVRQAAYLSGWAKSVREHNPDAVVLLAGDLNTTPDAHMIQYLTGRTWDHEQESTLWVDAWDVAGTVSTAPTVTGRNRWARQTAQRHGIAYPELLPDRRIDYVFSYGWCYGKAGCPILYSRFTGRDASCPASDHFGVCADILTYAGAGVPDEDSDAASIGQGEAESWPTTQAMEVV